MVYEVDEWHHADQVSLEQNMTEDSAGQTAQPPPSQATVADLMRPPLTTIELTDHAAAAAYLMKNAGTTALVVLNPQTGQPTGIITEADIAHAVADGKDLNEVRIHDLMTADPTIINTTVTIRDAAACGRRAQDSSRLCPTSRTPRRSARTPPPALRPYRAAVPAR
jgi:signal-transduction protein with cAMP-binding, CBS, and nucleotidyltransferase domain